MCRTGDVAALKVLLRKKNMVKSINVLDNFDLSALHYSAKYNNYQCARLLIAKGASECFFFLQKINVLLNYITIFLYVYSIFKNYDVVFFYDGVFLFYDVDNSKICSLNVIYLRKIFSAGLSDLNGAKG